MKKLLLFFLVLVFFLTSCNNDSSIIKNGKIVKIGVLVPLSGKNKRFSQQSLDGLLAAKKMQAYLENGTEIKFIVADTQSDIGETRKAFYSLVKQDVKVIISLMGSDKTIEMQAVLEANKIPLIVSLATDNKITNLANNISQVCFTNNIQALVAAHYIRDEKLISNVGIVYDRSNHYSYSLAKEFKKYYESIGGTVDFYMNVKNVKEVEKLKKKQYLSTSILYNTTDIATTLEILKFMKKKYPDMEYISGDGLLSSVMALKSFDKTLLNGVYVTEHYAHNIQKNKRRKHLEKLLKRDGYSESSYAFLAYDSYMLLYKALNRCENLDLVCINNHLQNSETIHGASGNFTMHHGVSKRKVFIDKIENMKLYKEIVTY